MFSNAKVRSMSRAASFDAGRMKPWWMRASISIVMLACSLVAIEAFGQPPSATTSKEASLHDVVSASGATSPQAQPKNAIPAWRTKVEHWIAAQRTQHPIVRSMSLPEDISVELRTKAQVGEYVDGFLDASAREMLASQDKILRTLDVLRTKKLYEEVLRELLVREVSGYYEPEDQTLYLVADRVEELDAAVVIHELQHLAQDMAWDLRKLLRPDWHQSDLLGARSALVEGDAMFTHVSAVNRGNPSYLRLKDVDAMRQGVQNINATLVDRYPRFVLDQLTMPYVEGLAFARIIYAYDGWHGLNDVYNIPPMSTAEILLPERYRKQVHPVFLHYNLELPSPQTRRYTDVWGMMTLRHIFYAIAAPEYEDASNLIGTIDHATAGWMGDRIELWEDRRGKDRHITWLIALSDADQAQELFELMTTLFAPLMDVPCRCAQGVHGQHCGRADAQRGMMLEQWGDMVLWAYAQSRNASALEEKLLAMADCVFSSVRRTTYPDMWRYHTLAHVPARAPDKDTAMD